MAATKTRTTKQEPKEEGPTQEEVALAAAQEQSSYMEAQLQYLQGRVASLRIEVNRLAKENAQLREE